uniref:J domain-containing protein n=1 Tax=Arion vulgaris TaxID=1028688 RepID=A0A0B7AY96_9EUPU
MNQCSNYLVHLAHSFKCRTHLNLTSRFSLCRQYSTKVTHYDILGITKEATSEDIRAAFIKKSKECHPDINRTDPNNHKKFVLVNEAYSVLNKPLSRSDYDASITYPHHRTYQQSMSQSSRPYGNYSWVDYDEQIRRAQNIRNEEHKMRSHYGTAGQKRTLNFKVVAACLLVMLISSVVHYFAVMKVSLMHKNMLDKQDAKLQEIWLNAKNKGAMNLKEVQLRRLQQKQTEDMEKKT